MEKLLSILLLLCPCKNTTITSDLSKQEILARLEDRFIPELTIGTRSFWSTNFSRYVGHIIGDHIDIDGPYGYKKWTLNTQVTIVDHGTISKVNLDIKLSFLNIFCIILVFGFYFIYSVFIIQFPFWQIMGFQLIFMYGIVLAVFRGESEYLVKLIRESLQEYPLPRQVDRG
jgi:hypothetical protein